MFTQPSTKPIPNGIKVVNQGFGNLCCICGQCFNEHGICDFGHKKGCIYYYPPGKKPKLTARTVASNIVVCQAFSGCRCTICGGFFADGDDICGLGGHQIGQKYAKRVG